ncbi:hypothetical protein L2E82_45842 [Cichorium intybus]|uniref:Uncharacterized protein n=1 Tax=Cichorium intybus TaxID=13427 RepID=A0ACB8ZVF7_CICIN|nr:hypothetical protein L2E82_45842 [Cichorium intybus]
MEPSRSMDNDDFVSPPPGVHKAGSKEGVADEGPISKSKDGSEGSKTKFTKNTASRLARQQPKGLTVAGDDEVNKNQGYIQGEKVVEENVNTEKVVAETSNKKGKMKMTEISKTKKRKVAEKERGMSLRIEKASVGNEAELQVKRHKMAKVEGD